MYNIQFLNLPHDICMYIVHSSIHIYNIFKTYFKEVDFFFIYKTQSIKESTTTIIVLYFRNTKIQKKTNDFLY